MQCFERGATYMSIANWSINEDYERYSYAWRMIADTWLGSSTPSVVVPTESSPTIEISLLELYRERNISSITNRHRLLSPNGEPVRIVIKDDLTSYIPQAPSNFAVFPSDFSSVQGGGGWYYKSYLDGKFTDMTFDASAGYWQGDSTYTRITGTNLHPDTHDAALVFKATDTGRISVNLYCRAASEFGDGIIFYILYNGSIFEVSGEEIRALVTDKTPYRLSFTAEVEEGDEIAFIINKNQHNTYDTTALSVYIKYE